MPYPPNLQPCQDRLARDAVIYTQPMYEMARMRAAGSPRRNAAGASADPNPDAGPESTRRRGARSANSMTAPCNCCRYRPLLS